MENKIFTKDILLLILAIISPEAFSVVFDSFKLESEKCYSVMSSIEENKILQRVSEKTIQNCKKINEKSVACQVKVNKSDEADMFSYFKNKKNLYLMNDTNKFIINLDSKIYTSESWGMIDDKIYVTKICNGKVSSSK